MSRLRPCVEEIPQNSNDTSGTIPPNDHLAVQNNSLENPNTSSENPNTTLENPIDSFENETRTCHYCLHTFSTKSHKLRHDKICKFKNDPVRILELELDIISELPESGTECRFCNKVFCRIDNLNRHITNCKERELYKQILIKENDMKNKINPVNTINNNNCNNNIQNQNNTNCNNNTNNLILNFGDTKDTVKTEEIIQILRNVNKEFAPEQKYLMAGEFVIRFDKLLTQTPENDNFVIPDSKCLYAEIKTPNGWEKISIDNSLNSCFRERASMLLERKEEINAFNDRVFQSKTNNEIFVETKQFAKRGFAHSYRGEDTRRIRTGLKINKLKKTKKN